MRTVALALATFREGVRSQVYVNLAVLAAFAVGAATVMEGLSLGERGRTLRDVGFAFTSVTNALLSVMMTVRTMGGEEDRRVLLTVLVRPVWRAEVVVGKFLGVCALLWVNTAVAGLLLAALMPRGGAVTAAGLVLPVVGLCVEAALVTAATLLFTTFAGTTVAAVMGLATWVVGLGAPELHAFTQREGGALGVLVTVAYHVMPNLQRIDFNAHVGSTGDVALALVDALLHLGAALALATLVFERRDLH